MEPNPKQQIAEKLRDSNNVLVTVSKDPTVDQLAATLGLALMLNKLGKHASAVFSGKIPDTMEFLNPEKTFDNTVDGLRDFIISLHKDKADKLRYKVEDDVVKIFITPYKGRITDTDLQFSQGDFNVDLVVALGVHQRADLDNAITSHGRILHDATIVTINSDEQESDLGSINWHEPEASSISEMLVSISEALQGNILDGAMSTALLTGIVAATERFSNEKTTPKVMTMSAQLMASGADQQLIVANLQKTFKAGDEIPQVEEPKKKEEPKPLPEPEEKLPEIKPEPALPEVKEDIDLPEVKQDISPAVDDRPTVEAPSVNQALGAEANVEPTTPQPPVMEHHNPGSTSFPPPPGHESPSDHQKDIDEARKQVDDAINSAPFSPDNNPIESLGAQPMSQDSPPLPPSPMPPNPLNQNIPEPAPVQPPEPSPQPPAPSPQPPSPQIGTTPDVGPAPQDQVVPPPDNLPPPPPPPPPPA